MEARLIHAGLEVGSGDFLERQEAVALGAIVDEGGFEAGLDARDDGFVDVALALFLGGRFNVEVDQLLTVDNGNAEFLGLRRIEEHALHSSLFSRAAHGQDEPRHPLNCGDLVWRYRDCPSSRGIKLKRVAGFVYGTLNRDDRWEAAKCGLRRLVPRIREAVLPVERLRHLGACSLTRGPGFRAVNLRVR